MIVHRSIANELLFAKVFKRGLIRYNECMKIEQSISLKEKIILLSKTQSFNITLADQLISLVLSNPSFIKKTNLVNKMQKDSLSELDAYQFLLLNQWLKDPVLKKHPDLLSLSVKPFLYTLDRAQYISNPFYQHIKPKPVTKGKWQLGYETYSPFQAVLTGDVVTNPTNHYLESTPVGYFTEPFYYLVIKQQDVTWMSVTPFEINTMAPILEKVKGNIITLGLGLGYFASMAALKPDVNEVLVIEKDQQVIDIFLKHIYPQLPNKEKIKIIHEDAFQFLKTNKRRFDHWFVDIYHTADDGLPIYIRVKKLEKISTYGQWHYWLESSIISLFRRYMIIFLQEQLLSFDTSHYQNTATIEEKIYRGLFLIHEKKSIDTVIELDYWLSTDSIRHIIASIEFI